MSERQAVDVVRSVSAFFPCYNDAGVIGDLVDRVSAALDDLGIDYEVIVVDDGSADDSVAVLRGVCARNPHLRLIEHPENRGYGAALRSGFEAAVKDWVFYTDGDGQYNPAEVKDLIETARDDTDFVQGWKLSRGDSWLRRIVGRAYHWTVKFLFRLDVRDTDCDFRLIRRSLLQSVHLHYDSGVICVEMLRKFKDVGGRFVEVPIHHYERPVGSSQFFVIPRILKSLWDLAKLWTNRMLLGKDGGSAG